MKTKFFFRRLVICTSALVAVGAIGYTAWRYIPALLPEREPADESSTATAVTTVPTQPSTFEGRLELFAKEHNLSLSAWPADILEAATVYPEKEDFVLNYPLLKGTHQPAALDAYRHSPVVPQLIQWDKRWGYIDYAGGPMGLTGCGPTALSMVAMYLLDDVSLSPDYVADFATEHGYAVNGNGSSWTLISKGGPQLGLKVTELILHKPVIEKHLEAGHPVICVVGPGDFTRGGHFIVMTGLEDGKIRINDPNSRINSEKLWDYERIKDQINNLWACEKP